MRLKQIVPPLGILDVRVKGRQSVKILAAILLLVGVACRETPKLDQPGSGQTRPGEEIIFPVHEMLTKMDSLLEGTLTQRGVCLYVWVEDLDRLILAIWPHGFSYDYADGNLAVLNPEGREVAEVGSHVSLGGGMLGESEGTRLPPELRPRVESCDGPYWIVGDIEQWSPRQEAGSFSGHGPLYESLDQLVSKSDLVVTGTVEKTIVGKVVGDDPTGKYPTRHLHTIIGVDEVLKGSDVEEVTIITDELAFTGPNAEEWRTQGSHVLLFLTPSRENEGLHILANINYIQTVYTRHGDDVRKTMGGDLYGLNDRIAGMTLPELRQAVSSL